MHAHETHNGCTSHDAHGWAHHNVWTALSDAARTAVERGHELAAELAARDAGIPGSGRNPLFDLDGASIGATAPTSPAHPVTLSAVVARRRAVRRGRYAGAQCDTVRLDGVAYASNGDQVLSETAIAWSERVQATTVRYGACDAPFLFDNGDGSVRYVTADDSPAAKRARRKTPETAAKEIARAIENVAAGKRPEGWARDRIERFAELFDVDVYDAQCDALDAALDARATAQPDAPVMDGGSIQASRV